jgi:hypothetical protein
MLKHNLEVENPRSPRRNLRNSKIYKVAISGISQTLLVCGFWIIREERQPVDTMGCCEEKYEAGQNDFQTEPEILRLEKFA